MTYISTRDGKPNERDTSTTRETEVLDVLKLEDITINDRYKEFINGTCRDANEYLSAYVCSNSLNEIECIGMTRKHGLHEQLNTIITRLNEMEKLLSAIARNTQAITYKKTKPVEE